MALSDGQSVILRGLGREFSGICVRLSGPVQSGQCDNRIGTLRKRLGRRPKTSKKCRRIEVGAVSDYGQVERLPGGVD